SIFESLHAQSRKHTFIFVGFTAEEQGLVGSEFYAHRLSKEEKARLRAMINLDTLGLSYTRVWVSRSDQALYSALLRVATAMQLPVGGVNIEQVGSADSESFRTRKIPAITIHSLTQETLPILHTSRDTFASIKLDDYYDTYRLLTAYLVHLDQSLE